MKRTSCTLAALILGAAFFGPTAASLADDAEPGFTSLFNGKDLTGWEGRPEHWSVEDGAITGRTTREHPAQGNNFLIWRPNGENGTVDDFELRLSYKFTGTWGNSGIQYRSKDFGKFVVGGYQADCEVGTTFSGILYEERMRGILAQRGQKVVIHEGDAPNKPKIEAVGTVGNSKEIQAAINVNGWNDYVVIAKGNHLQQFINGKQTVDVVDETAAGAKRGILALQLHAGEPMMVQFKNIRIKTLSAASAKKDLDAIQGTWAPTELVAKGQAVPADDLGRVKLAIKGKEYTVQFGDGEDSGTFEIVESAQPKQMNVVTRNGDQIPAIYEVSGDTMRVCYATGGESRPTEFKSTEGSNRVMAVYKRQQP